MSQKVKSKFESEEFKPEDLKAEQERIAIEKRSIIRDLNKIKHPISATIFTHGKTWTIRNIAFWQAMNKRDDEIVNFMETYTADLG